MKKLQQSSNNIQRIPAYPTRRTTPEQFATSLMSLLLSSLYIVEEEFDPDVIFRYADDLEFAFDTLRQKIHQRKFPRTFEEMWPYIGLPQYFVSESLGVSMDLLDERMGEGGVRLTWPSPFRDEYVLLAVQFIHVQDVVNNLCEDFKVDLITLPRRMEFNGIRDYLKDHFQITKNYDEGYFEVHVDLGGKRCGPLYQEEQWLEVLDHEDFAYKVDILMVHFN